MHAKTYDEWDEDIVSEGCLPDTALLFEDKFGRIWHPNEVDRLSFWEVEELGIHVSMMVTNNRSIA